MNNLAAIPIAAVLLHALAVLEVPGFVDLGEGFVVAHPPHLSQNKALDSEHIILCAPGYVSGPVTQYTGGLYARAYEGYDGSDYCEIEMVYEAQPGGDLTAHAAACAKAVADGSPRARQPPRPPETKAGPTTRTKSVPAPPKCADLGKAAGPWNPQAQHQGTTPEVSDSVGPCMRQDEPR
ncbi:hypothetical protein ABZ445_44915 [Streptomyces chartreusis]|uniref:hypothetical protein n=1 Tax=Streptomyces chartreusis TaxID=1969 RepID=UPI0033CB260B